MLDISKLNVKQQCFLAALVGDALGVPHEFKSTHALREDFIHNPSLITDDYKTYQVDLGIYSDDFSQILCVENYLQSGETDITKFYDDLLAWSQGKYWVKKKLFDIGTQTASQLKYYQKKMEVKKHDQNMSGNGSLMRILPVAFTGLDNEEMIDLAYEISYITHNSQECLLSCAFYCILIKNIFYGANFSDAWYQACQITKFNPDEKNPYPNFGSGYVLDSLMAVHEVIMTTKTFDEAVVKSIMFGGDTDTTSCIVAPVAALVFGIDNINPEWLKFIKPSLDCKEVKKVLA